MRMQSVAMQMRRVKVVHGVVAVQDIGIPDKSGPRSKSS